MGHQCITKAAINKFGDCFIGRFSLSVQFAGPAECWYWVGAKTAGGYGTIKLMGRTAYAHRLAYEVFGNGHPGNLSILHSCDNPSCVNPDHLRAGTQGDNMRDMAMKGRQARGTKNGRAKLSERDVAEIRKLTQQGTSFSSLSVTFGVSETCIRQAARGNRWHHLRLAALSSADHDRYLSQQADQRRAETIATIDADLVWQQAQGAI